MFAHLYRLLTPAAFGHVVHPAFHNKNLLTFLNAGPIASAGRHAKVWRNGYKAWAANR
jgi:hypothetical protein